MKIVNLVEDTAGDNACLNEHGLSFYIETKNHKLLMDCGTTDMFLHNAKILDVDVTCVDTVILSHGHYDHSGGILPFTQLNSQAKIYLKEFAGDDYYHLTKSGEERYIGIDKKILQLPQVVLVQKDKKLDEELFLFTNITGTKYLAKGNLELKKKMGNDFMQDTFEHEQCLVLTCEDKHILLSGCAHNGILNILDEYFARFQQYPDVVISGFHMVKKEDYTKEEIVDIQSVAKALLETQAVFYTGHCTGQPAYDIMKEIMGERLLQIHSGMRIF